MLHNMKVELPTSVLQGDYSVVALLGSLAAGLRGAAIEKGQKQGPNSPSVKEKQIAAQILRDCIDRLRRECGEHWREFHAKRKDDENRTDETGS